MTIEKNLYKTYCLSFLLKIIIITISILNAILNAETTYRVSYKITENKKNIGNTVYIFNSIGESSFSIKQFSNIKTISTKQETFQHTIYKINQNNNIIPLFLFKTKTINSIKQSYSYNFQINKEILENRNPNTENFIYDPISLVYKLIKDVNQNINIDKEFKIIDNNEIIKVTTKISKNEDILNISIHKEDMSNLYSFSIENNSNIQKDLKNNLRGLIKKFNYLSLNFSIEKNIKYEN